MGASATVSAAKTPVSRVLPVSHGAAHEPLPAEIVEQVGMMITGLPVELQPSARALLQSVVVRVAIAEHFDAFCGQAFSKPEWAGVASPMIAELFDHDEDQLAELARIPDLVIELGSGQATVTCMVASRWAARGETHRLSRLAESIVASHASKNACAVEVMLALAATLAVTRFSRAEHLYNAALPLAGAEHQEALADARRWLGAGRVVCSAAQEERDFWDVRLRKPRTAWPWQSEEELRTLEHLSECLTSGSEGGDLFKAVLPAFWWELAMKCAQQQEKLADAAELAVRAKSEVTVPQRVLPERVPPPDLPAREIRRQPKAGVYALFVVCWVCGAMAMAITVVLLPADAVNRVLNMFQTAESTSPGRLDAPGKAALRQGILQKMAVEMARYAPQHALAKSGNWQENELMLSGHSRELPHESQEYMKLLVWLHLDPPQDAEVRRRVPKLLLKRVKEGVIVLWEELTYSGSPNVEEIKNAAREALAGDSYQWSAKDKDRLHVIAGFENDPKDMAVFNQ